MHDMYDDFFSELAEIAEKMANQDGAQIIETDNYYRALFERCPSCGGRMFYVATRALYNNKKRIKKYVVCGCPCGAYEPQERISLPTFKMEWVFML